MFISMTTSRRGLFRLGGAVAVSAATGALALRGASADTAPEAPTQRFYLGTYTDSGGQGIARGSVDPVTGTPTVDYWTASLRQPSWVDLSPDGQFLYAVSELQPNGTVSALRLSADGDPSTLLNTRRTGSAPCHVAVHPNGQFLFTSLYLGKKVVTHRINADGTVSAFTDEQLTGGNTHQVVIDPTGEYVLAVDLGVSSVFTYRLNTATGTLGSATTTTLASGSGSRHMAFHPNGAYAYVAGESDSTVTVCTWADGVLTKTKNVVSTLLSDPGVTNYVGEILTSADGRFVYVTNRGSNTIAVFAVSDDGATLTLVATPSCGGNWPRHLAIDATGTWMYAANQFSGDITWFGIDATTGVPGPAAGKIVVPGVAQLRFV
jgi:6-phosphogluconolactonase